MDHENRRLEQKVKVLKDLNDVFEYVIALYSFSISKEKKDEVISMVLSKLAKRDSFSLVLLFLLIYFKRESLWYHHLPELDFKNEDSFIYGEVKFWSWYLVNWGNGEININYRSLFIIFNHLFGCRKAILGYYTDRESALLTWW